MVKNLPAVQGTWVWSLGWEYPLEKEMATHSSVLAWRIPWIEEPGGPQSMGSHRVGHNRVTKQQQQGKWLGPVRYDLNQIPYDYAVEVMNRFKGLDLVDRVSEELYKKDLNDPDNQDGVIIHLEPDIPECEVRWALGSITTNKASRGDGMPVEVFQILKDDAVKVLNSICKQIWKTQQWTQD